MHGKYVSFYIKSYTIAFFFCVVPLSLISISNSNVAKLKQCLDSISNLSYDMLDYLC